MTRSADEYLKEYGFIPSYGRRYVPTSDALYYPMTSFLSDRKKLETKIWPTGPVLNQGVEGSCVGHAWAAWLMAEPTVTMDGPSPYLIYTEAQKRDPWADEPHEGTTVAAAASWLLDQGHIERFVWARNAREIANWIVTYGPVVLGTAWFESMHTVNSLGFVKPEGEIVGGHSFLAHGFDVDLNAFLCINSWGPAFGKNGHFYIAFRDMDILLRSFGEACSAIEKRKDDNLMPFTEKIAQGPYRERMHLAKWRDDQDKDVDEPYEVIECFFWYDEDNNQITDPEEISRLEALIQ